MNSAPSVLTIENLSVTYAAGAGRTLKALRGVDLSLERGETLAIVGESGSGKTTLVRAALRLFDIGTRPAVTGRVAIEGRDIYGLSATALRESRRRAQLVFQDPYASLDPRMRVGDIVLEPLAIHRLTARAKRPARVRELLMQVGLPDGIERRFPSALSGGQRQRVGIARALAVDPELLVLDEPLSALDVSVQAQVINLLVELREQRKLSYLLIAHDLRLVRYLATRVAVMYLGKIVEIGATEDVLGAPRHPYTQLLLRSAPRLQPGAPGEKAPEVPIAVEPPSPFAPPPGCAFAARCPLAMPVCRELLPELESKGRGLSQVACFAVPKGEQRDGGT